MKKRLFLVNYKFTTAGHEYSEYKLVSIKFEGQMDEEWGRQLAEAELQAWFDRTFVESELTAIIATTALEKEYPKKRAGESHKPAMVPLFGWFSSDEKPLVDPDSDPEDGLVSDQVLIDIDGTKTVFATGKYHSPHGDMPGWWDVGEFYQSALKDDKMRWSYLPLARYDDKPGIKM